MMEESAAAPPVETVQTVEELRQVQEQMERDTGRRAPPPLPAFRPSTIPNSVIRDEQEKISYPQKPPENYVQEGPSRPWAQLAKPPPDWDEEKYLQQQLQRANFDGPRAGPEPAAPALVAPAEKPIQETGKKKQSAPPVKGDPKDLLTGGVLQCIAAGTLGLPFEVVKTRQASFPKESVVDSMKTVYAGGGRGYRAFWSGFDAKMTESFFKGGVFLYSKDYLEKLAAALGAPKGSFLNGCIAGAGAGVAQTAVMAPMTFVITYRVNHPESRSSVTILKEAGLKRAYAGASAIAARQASNWALRQGLVNWINNCYRSLRGKNAEDELSLFEHACCGLLGGGMAAVNQPIEVIRISIQKRGGKNMRLPSGGIAAVQLTIAEAARNVYAKHGFRGFYAGVIPRIAHSAYQAMFMVSFASLATERVSAWRIRAKHTDIFSKPTSTRWSDS